MFIRCKGKSAIVFAVYLIEEAAWRSTPKMA